MKAYEIMVTAKPDRIKAARAARGLSQAAAARAAGITQAYLCLLEKGKQRAATNTVAAKIAAALEETPEALFEGYVPPKHVKAGGGLSAEEKSRLAEDNLKWVRVIAWEQRGYFQFDFEEAFSFSLVCFAEALNKYDGTGNLKTNIARTIKSRAISELRKQTAAKRKAEGIIYLDNALEGKNGKQTELYNFMPDSFNLEEFVILREECREAAQGLSPWQRRSPEIAGLLECVGL